MFSFFLEIQIEVNENTYLFSQERIKIIQDHNIQKMGHQVANNFIRNSYQFLLQCIFKNQQNRIYANQNGRNQNTLDCILIQSSPKLSIIFICVFCYTIGHFQMKFSQLKELGKMFQPRTLIKSATEPLGEFEFRPTTFLSHPLLQSVYNLAEPKISVNYERERIFFVDGGHIALDWSPRTHNQAAPPILFIMHGLTGGSEMNYIRALTEEAMKEGYQCVCLNSRGINAEMTSPVPFTAIEHTELNAAIERVQMHFPISPIYMVGTSFGGNYLIRYLLRNRLQNIKGLIALAPPFDVKKVVDDMPPIYQRFFVKRYIWETVEKHPEMKYWQDIGLVNLKEVSKSKNLRQFHSRITTKILGYESTDYLFNQYSISGQMIRQLGINTLLMASKDDPIVSYGSMPLAEIKENPNIKFVATEKGGHLCWYEGLIPKRWYPKPVLNYLRSLREVY